MFMKDKKNLKQLTYACLTAAQLVMPDNVYAGLSYASQADLERQQRIAVRQQNLKRLDDEDVARRKAVLENYAKEKEEIEKAAATQKSRDEVARRIEFTQQLKKAN